MPGKECVKIPNMPLSAANMWPLISGTKGAAQKYPLPARVSVGSEWLNDEEGERAIDARNSGADWEYGPESRRTWRNGLPDDMAPRRLPAKRAADLYDAAAWSVIIPLSEKSVSNRARPLEIPDFRRGAWRTNQPVDINLTGEGGSAGMVF